ncbi:hypothetical protein ABK040_002285 [Willaertia magna]
MPTTSNVNRRNVSGFHLFGTPIYNEDGEENSKLLRERGQERYLPEHKQYVLDEKGRKRLHGAFKGGFSAGYFNTVGSKEGWRPKDYSKGFSQSVTDFMDEEDMNEILGASSNQVQVTDHYKEVSSSDHLRMIFGTIENDEKSEGNKYTSGFSIFDVEPQMNNNKTTSSLFNNNNNIGFTLLNKLGWKDNTETFSLLQQQEPKENNNNIHHGLGFQPKSLLSTITTSHDNNKTKEKTVKGNSGRSSITTKTNNEKKDDKLIAFGSMHEDDIYNTDDLSNYDIELKPTTIDLQEDNEGLVSWISEDLTFHKAKHRYQQKKTFKAPLIPETFIPVHQFNESLMKQNYKKLDHKIQIHLKSSEEQRKILQQKTFNNEHVKLFNLDYLPEEDKSKIEKVKRQDYLLVDDDKKVNSEMPLVSSEKVKELKEKLLAQMSNKFVTGGRVSTNSSSSSNKVISNKRSVKVGEQVDRVISEWNPQYLVSKRFGFQAIQKTNKEEGKNSSSQKLSIYNDKLFDKGNENVKYMNTIVIHDKLEETKRPSLDLFKQVFFLEKKINNQPYVEDIVPVNEVILHDSENERVMGDTVIVRKLNLSSSNSETKDLDYPEIEKTIKNKVEVHKSSHDLNKIEERIKQIKELLGDSESDEDEKKEKKRREKKKKIRKDEKI